MKPEDWEAKYKEMIDIAKELTNCPLRYDENVSCYRCPRFRKCMTIILLIKE